MRLHATLILGAALVLGACGGHLPPQAGTARVDLLLASERGMENVVIDSRHAYLGLSNSAGGASAVWRSGRIIRRSSVWEPLDLGQCALGPAGGLPLSTPRLARLEGAIWLFQQPGRPGEHARCRLERAAGRFDVRTEGPRDRAEALPGVMSHLHIVSFLALRADPANMLVAGADKGTGRPYLGWSRDGGNSWTDLSPILPGYGRAGLTVKSTVTSLMQDPSGRVLLTLNEEPGSQGRLLMLTLAPTAR
ncbi:MAG: hypothetical protein V4723_16025 [Pseudomonadota bacterium]